MKKYSVGLTLVCAVLISLNVYADPIDPGARTGPAGAGGTFAGADLSLFTAATDKFTEVEDVSGGLGPRFNSNSCKSCHSQPAIGGTSPSANPLFAVYNLNGAKNRIPYFIKSDGPVREARFKFFPDGSRDGSVHDLFTITGRADAPLCFIAQPDFEAQQDKNNIIFRIPTPVFGGGLIESIPDKVILANKNSLRDVKESLGIKGHENRSGNDGTITRFGWKAQNKSVLMFSGEAYNVEMGVTNELFPQERDETKGCTINLLPEDISGFNPQSLSDIEFFSFFIRLLAPPTPEPLNKSTKRGKDVFTSIGCYLCHTPTLTPTESTSLAVLANQDVNLFSDLLLHNMGSGLADDIVQGTAGPSEFRTAPLWGVGQRIFFLHDGRTKDLVEVIKSHRSPGSEANGVIDNFDDLSDTDKQDLLYFLRSL